jgi:hypothetical protein
LPTDLAGVLDRYQCFTYSLSESPSKEWLYYSDCHALSIGYGTSAVLFNQDTRQYWNYPYCKYYTQYNDEGCPMEGYLSPTTWSSDGEYLYVLMTSGGDGGLRFDYVTKLISINLGNGFASVFVDSVAVYEFSPGAKKLAYIPWTWEGSGDEWLRQPITVFVRDLEYRTEFKLILESGYDDAGAIVWSPDGNRFVFLAVQYDNARNIESSTLMLVDVAEKSRGILIKNFPASINSILWTSDESLELRNAIGKPVIYYNIKNRQMTAIPSPYPTVTKTYKEPENP